MTDRILEIIQRNYDKFTGTNEAELHAAEEIAGLFGKILTEKNCIPNVIQSEKRLDEQARLCNPKTENGKSEFHLGWRLCYEWVKKQHIETLNAREGEQ